MSAQALIDIARTLVADDKGLLAMDESNGTCNKRFAAAGIAETLEARRAYRELIVTTPGLAKCISGVILYDETLRQGRQGRRSVPQIPRGYKMIPGIRWTPGQRDLAAHPGETITEGLDGLRERLAGILQAGGAVREMARRHRRWPRVFPDGSHRGEAGRHWHAMRLCQEAVLVPIVEPEVLMDGGHTLARCEEVTNAVLRRVFDQLSLPG